MNQTRRTRIQNVGVVTRLTVTDGDGEFHNDKGAADIRWLSLDRIRYFSKKGQRVASFDTPDLDSYAYLPPNYSDADIPENMIRVQCCHSTWLVAMDWYLQGELIGHSEYYPDGAIRYFSPRDLLYGTDYDVYTPSGVQI